MEEAAPSKQQEKQEKEKQGAPQPPSPLAVLRSGVGLIKKAVDQKETRTLFGRLLRQTAAVRRRWTAADLCAFLEGSLPASSPASAQLLEAVKQVREAVCLREGRFTGWAEPGRPEGAAGVRPRRQQGQGGYQWLPTAVGYSRPSNACWSPLPNSPSCNVF